MVNIYLKKHSATLAIQEMKIKTALMFGLVPFLLPWRDTITKLALSLKLFIDSLWT